LLEDNARRCGGFPLSANVVQNGDMSAIELGGINSDLDCNKPCLGNRAIVITTIQS
jgi:hypothetical protein